MEPVLHSFGYSLDFLREQLADIAPADMAAQPPGITNHPTWVVGHLTHTCQRRRDWPARMAPADWADR